MRCPHCGFEDPEDYAYCSDCGQPRLAAAPPGAYPAAGDHQIAGAYAQMAPPATPGPRAAYATPGPTEGRSARLVGLEGPVEGQEFELSQPEMAIGRRSDCDIVVPDPSVSRLHARVRLGPGGAYAIEDAESANGTWVNGVRLAPAQAQPLMERDVIRIGKAAFSFRAEVRASSMPPPAQTWIQDPGVDPSPFGSDSVVLSEAALAPPPPESLPTPPEPVAPAPIREPAWSGPSPSVPPVEAVRSELAELKRDLDPFIARLNALAQSVGELEGQLDGGPAPGQPSVPPALRQLASELEADGNIERYRALERLLEELRDDPTDLKLLLRLSDELPTISRLVQAYLRALSVIRQLSP